MTETVMQRAEETSQRQAVMTAADLSFHFTPGVEVIHALSAALMPGRLTVMLGPNAAGKSTLLRLMLGQLVPATGSVALAGENVHLMAAARRAELISYVPQRSALQFAYSVEQVVRMGRFALSRDDAAIERALEMADLLLLRERVYGELSIGQQQRVLFGRSIAQSLGGGAVMLLDEPGSAMDLRHVHELMQVLMQLAADGLAVLAVMHDLNIAARYADDVWLMDDGRLAGEGPWEKILVPRVLEPVYQVGLVPVQTQHHARPVFISEPIVARQE